jgi:hypothetical protein
MQAPTTIRSNADSAVPGCLPIGASVTAPPWAASWSRRRSAMALVWPSTVE